MRWMLAVALSLLVLALPAQATRQEDSATMTIRLFSTDTFSKVLVERAPNQEISKGDVVVVESILRNAAAQFGRPKGAIVGNDITIFTVLSARQAGAIVESRLPGGWLRAAGRIRFGAEQSYSVTGGTGRFAHARGTCEAHTLEHHDNRRLKVYRLRLP